MRLIEKECPNCGASLSFTKEDTSCKCEYCKREFEIERDTDKKKLDDQFNLSELKTPFKIFSYFTVGSFVAQGIIFVLAFIVIVIIAINIFKGFHDSNSIFNRNASLITEASELKNSDFSNLDLNSKVTFSKETIGTSTQFTNNGKLKREKVYVISNKKRNIVIPIYVTVYENFFNKDEKYTLYVPFIYKNVKTRNNSISYSLDDGELSAPEYHFANSSDYSYGYDMFETLYNEIIKPFEKDYKITEK